MNLTLFGRALSKVGGAIMKHDQASLRQAMKSKYGKAIVEGTATATFYRQDRAVGAGIAALATLTVAAGANTLSKQKNISDEELFDVINEANSLV